VAGQIRRGYPDVEHEQRDGDAKMPSLNASTRAVSEGPLSGGSAIDRPTSYTPPFFPIEAGASYDSRLNQWRYRCF